MAAENLKGVKIGFIGAGNMAKAIGGGLVKYGVVDKSQIFVYAPSHRNFDWWDDTGVSWTEKSQDIVSSCDIIFLAMKPQTFNDATEGLNEVASTAQREQMKLAQKDELSPKKQKLWVSVLAGTTLSTLENRLRAKSYKPAIVRIMANTPMTIGQGCSVFCGNELVTEHEKDKINTILSSLGKTFEVKEEQIDSISSLMGNSPAYMYAIIEAMSDVGVKMGVPRALAIQLSAQAMVGSAQMVLQTGRHPGVLKDEVCSPGGSTIVGLHVLEQRGVRAAIMDTLEAAAAKNKELGKIAESR